MNYWKNEIQPTSFGRKKQNETREKHRRLLIQRQKFKRGVEHIFLEYDD